MGNGKKWSKECLKRVKGRRQWWVYCLFYCFYCQEIDVLRTNVSVLLINDVLLIANLLIDVLLINVVYGGGDVWMKSGKFSKVF